MLASGISGQEQALTIDDSKTIVFKREALEILEHVSFSKNLQVGYSSTHGDPRSGC